MTDLKDLIKSAQTGFVADAGKLVPKEKPVRALKKPETPPEPVVAAIRSMEKGAVLDRAINVRISDSVHKKLRLYGQEGLKLQWIVSHAIDRLLETEEMKSLFDKIKRDMDGYV